MQNLIGLQVLENVFLWSKFKAHSCDIFFSWTFDLLFINSSIDIYCLEFISHRNKEILYVNTNAKGNQSWNKNKDIHIFTCFWCIGTIPYQQFLLFLSFMNINILYSNSLYFELKSVSNTGVFLWILQNF